MSRLIRSVLTSTMVIVLFAAIAGIGGGAAIAAAPGSATATDSECTTGVSGWTPWGTNLEWGLQPIKWSSDLSLCIRPIDPNSPATLGVVTQDTTDERSTNQPWNAKNAEIATIMFVNPSDISLNENSANLFSDMVALVSIEGIGQVNTSNVTNMDYMFFGAQSLKSLDLSGWNTRNVTSMNWMFKHAIRLKNLTLGVDSELSYASGLSYPSGFGQTGNWVEVGTGTTKVPHGPLIFPPIALVAESQSVAGFPGTYVWQRYLRVGFDSNGGSGTVPPQISGETGENLDLRTEPLTKPGYQFTGWNTQSNGQGDSYPAAPGQFLPGGTTTLFAQWTNLFPDPPGKPTTVITGVGSVAVTVTPPDAGPTADSYTVSADPSGATCTVAATTKPPSCSITGLDPNTQYAFTATAANPAGTSEASPATDNVYPNLVPSIPGKPVSTVTGSGIVAVSVSPAESGSGGVPTSYTVTANPGGQSCKVAAATSLLPCTVIGLDPDLSYRFTTTATDSAGTSSASEPSDLTFPGSPGTPGKPVVVATGSGSVAITVVPPAVDSGGPVFSYTVISDPGDGSCTIAAATNPLTCSISGLNKDSPYSFSVAATGPGGNSRWSSSSTWVTPNLVPGVPGKPNAIVTNNGSVAVTFAAAPVDSGGEPDTYTVTASPGGQNCMAAASANPLGCTVTALDPYTAYTFTATATDSAGTSVASEPSDSIIPGPPGTPGIPGVAVTGSGVVAITVVPPAVDSGGPVTSYMVISDPGDESCTVSAATNPQTCSISGLTVGSPYSFSVTATGPAGTSRESSASKQVVP